MFITDFVMYTRFFAYVYFFFTAWFAGGMIPKVDCCVEAVRRGVKHAIIMDGRIEHSILIELLTDAGIGTMFR